MKGRDLILGLLMEKSRTGYEINEVLESIFSHFYKSSYGMIYPTLKKLQEQGLVEKKVVFQEGKPNKNVFTITPEGEQEFYKYLETDISEEWRESEFMVRMYLGDYVTHEQLLSWILDEITLKKKLIEELQNNYEEWKLVMNYSQKITYEIGVKQYEAELEILSKKVKELKIIIKDSNE